METNSEKERNDEKMKEEYREYTKRRKKERTTVERRKNDWRNSKKERKDEKNCVDTEIIQERKKE